MLHKPVYLSGQAARLALDFSECWVYVATPLPALPPIRGAVAVGWHRGDLMDALYNGSVLSEARFAEIFPECVPLNLPPEAFRASIARTEHRDRVGPLDPESWCSDPTGFLKD